MSDPKVNPNGEEEARTHEGVRTGEEARTAEDGRPAEEELLSDDMIDYDALGDAPVDDGQGNAHDPSADPALLDELQKTKDQLLRAVAELENMRKRAERDKESARKYAVQDFAKDIVVVADNLQRALVSIPEEARADDASQGLKNFITGVEMTDKALIDAFGKHGLQKVDPQPGDAFDYNIHQAMQQVDGTDYAPGSVAQVWQTGWLLNGRLLRPAMVAVAAGEPADKPSVDTQA